MNWVFGIHSHTVMGLLSNKIDRDHLRPGDHIYSWRNAYLYAHHGPKESVRKKAHRTNLDAESWGSKRARHDDLANETTSPPTDHASYDGGKTVISRLKSVVVHDLIPKPRSPKPSLKGSPTNLKKQKSRPKQVETERKDLERKPYVSDSKRKALLQKEHSPIPSSKEVGRHARESASLENALRFPENVSEPLMKNLALKLPSPEPLRDDPDSKSGSTEPMDLDACETGDEGFCQQNETSSILRTIFNAGLNERWGDFIIIEVEDILRKMSLSQPLELITNCRGEVQKSLEMLGPVIASYGSGKDRFERFVENVGKTFELADMLSKNTRIVEECSKIDVERIRNLIRSHEECYCTKAMLDLELSGLNQEFEVLRAREEHVIKAEQQPQQLRQKYELAKESLEERIAFLKDFADQQNRRDEELRQTRIEAKENQLIEFELLKSSHEAQEEEFKRLVNSLRSFGEV